MDLSFTPKIISFNGYGEDKYMGTDTSGPNDPAFAQRILCEGDSWFSIGAIPSSNLLFPLRFTKSTLLVNLAKPGDTISNMSDIAANPFLYQLIAEENFLTKWNAIFLSGGGNDLINMINQIICTPSVGSEGNILDYIDTIELAKLKFTVQQGYYKIAKMRDGTVNANTPIITHVYDYPTPRNAKAKILGIGVVGPWIYSALKSNDVPKKYWISITDYLFEFLVIAITELSYKIDNFYVVTSTRNSLIRAELDTKEESGDWLNEIHPTAAGYKKLAALFSVEVANIVQ